MAECPTCYSFDYQMLHTPLRISVRDVEQSARDGCRTCALVRDGFARLGSPLAEQDETCLVHLFLRPSGSGDTFYVELQDEGGHSILPLEIYALPDSPTPWKAISIRTNISGDTESESSFARIESWLQACVREHSLCRSDGLSHLPKRVLDLGKTDGMTIKLCESEEAKDVYACLSHCWGKLQPLKTTSKTIEAHKDGIVEAEMPKTFRDAIKVCRRLGIRYIWIDSLCIIQDSKADWEVESSKMASIYENALLTVSASCAVDGSVGCFRQSVPKELLGHELDGTTADGQPYKCFVRWQIDHYAPLTQSFEKKWPLMDRAWTFQERLLSPRVVNFGQHEIFWECREKTACECSSFRHTSKAQYARTLNIARSNISAAFKLWRLAVRQFSLRKLTYESDRLPAISGAAQQFIAAVGAQATGQYLAGVWANDLLWSLLWCAESFARLHGKSAPRPTRWRAPSWSWASIEGSHTFLSDSICRHIDESLKGELVQHFQVIHARCEPSIIDPFGAIKQGGELILMGLLRAYVLRKRRRPGTWRTYYNPLDGYALFPLGDEDEGKDKPGSSYPVKPDYPLLEENIMDPENGIEVFALRMASMIERASNRAWVFALVLRRLEEVGTYERVGILRQEYRKDQEHLDIFYGKVKQETVRIL